jgi:beta-fructofuranosidase
MCQDVMERGSRPLDLTIVVDGGVLEVYANNRFVLSTRVSPWYSNSTNISFFAEDGSIEFSDVVAYKGLIDAWSERSTPQVYINMII